MPYLMEADSRAKHSNVWPVVRFGDVARNVNDNVRDPLSSDLERYVGLEHLDPSRCTSSAGA